MCGIAAVFAYGEGAPPVDRDEVLRMREQMFSRGPDGEGEWFSSDGRVGLGHRRLSIIDLSPAGAQPMFNADRSLAIMYNGEIYNYRELRSQLAAKGYRFQSNCDTEVLLALYEVLGGDRMLDEVRGMYAFAIWDRNKQGLFLARDPFGIKPLYYSDNGHTFRVASQLKALRAGGKVDLAPGPAGHVGFFLWGHVPDPYTLFRNIRSLPAGHTMWVDRNGARSPKEFCSIVSILSESENRHLPSPNSQFAAGRTRRGGLPVRRRTNPPWRAPSSPQDEPAAAGSELLRSALAETVKYHLVADVPVGVFLSSGLDSTTIAALAAEQGGTLRTVTLGFNEYKETPEDETPLAEQFARRCGAAHQTIWVSRADFEAERDHLFKSMDRPTIDGVNTFFISLAAKRAGLKVALSGLGGDELFATYPSFDELPRSVRFFGAFRHWRSFGAGLRILSAPILKRFTSPKYAGLFEYGSTYPGAYLLRRGLFMPWELPDLLDPEMVREGWHELQTLVRLDETLDGIRNPRLKISALEMSWYMRHQLLRDSDWAGMGHSVEIRVPFVDVELLRQLGPLLASKHPPAKRDMAAAVSPLVTDEMLKRQKTGFQIPVRNWLLARSKYERLQEGGRHRGLRGWAREVYAHFASQGDGLYPLAFIARRSRAQAARPVKAANAKFRVLMLLTDGFGGFGGIAKFNRDFMTALSSSADVERIVAVPRLMHESPGTLPANITHVTAGLGGKQSYIRTVLRAARRLRASRSRGLRPVIICAHINLLPAAVAARRIIGADLYLIIHGVDAWQPTRDPITNACLREVDDFIAVSAVTRRRFLQWSGLRQDQGIILPNCVDLAAFRPAPKSVELVQRYQLGDDRVLFTLGRIASEERYKGFDEIIECLPDIGTAIPNVTYIIAGDGPDRPRLVSKAQALGLQVDDCSTLLLAPSSPMDELAMASSPFADGRTRRGELRAPRSLPRVIFVGRIGEDVKADYLRLGDVFVMPSSGEGFGIVLLEAMACGIPVIGSRVDGSREALRQGELGRLVDPANPSEIKEAVVASLTSSKPDRTCPIPGVEYFSKERFEERVHAIFRAIRGGPTQPEDSGRPPRSTVDSKREETLVAALTASDVRCPMSDV